MTAAIFGLVGVLVGGVLQTFLALVLDGRRDARALQAWARLLAWDVASFQTAYQRALELDPPSWFVLPEYPLPLEQWHEARYLVSARLGLSDEWRKVSQAFFDAEQVNTLAARKTIHSQMLEPAQRILARDLIRAKESIAALTPYVRGEHFWRARVARTLMPWARRSKVATAER
jgi:hypothetical protein